MNKQLLLISLVIMLALAPSVYSMCQVEGYAFNASNDPVPQGTYVNITISDVGTVETTTGEFGPPFNFYTTGLLPACAGGNTVDIIAWNIIVYGISSGTIPPGGGVYEQNVTIDISWFDTIPPNITLIAPANNTLNTTSHNIIFYYNVTDDSAIANCSLVLNDIINQTNSSVIINASTNNFTATLIDGNYNWSINCTDSAGNTGVSDVYNLTINITEAGLISSPNITIRLSDDNKSVTLNWSNISNADSYRLYYSDNVSLIIYLNISNVPSNVYNITLTDANYTDANLTSQRYYRVSAVLGSAENLSQQTVGKYIIGLEQGLNAFSIIFNSTENNLSQVLRTDVPGAIKTVYYYNGSYTKVDYLNNYTKEIAFKQSNALFVNSVLLYNLTLVGYVQNTTINLSSGLNLVGSPYYYDLPLNESLNTDPSNCIKTIYRFNSYNNYSKIDVVDNKIVDFTNSSIKYLERGRAYWVIADKGCIWK